MNNKQTKCIWFTSDCPNIKNQVIILPQWLSKQTVKSINSLVRIELTQKETTLRELEVGNEGKKYS